MFLLGHAAHGYMISTLAARSLNTRLTMAAALTIGILPDFDILLANLGVEHHLWTHSALPWLPPAVLLYLRYGRKTLPYVAGIYSHLLTDAMVGEVPAFYPLSPLQIGLALPVHPVLIAILEVGGLLVALAYMKVNGDLQFLTEGSRQSPLFALPLFSIVTLPLLYAEQNRINIPETVFSTWAMSSITMGHLFLIALLSMGILTSINSPNLGLGPAPQPPRNSPHKGVPKKIVVREVNPEQSHMANIWSLETLQANSPSNHQN